MKINSSNGVNLNPYLKHLNKQAAAKQQHRSDQLEISAKAKELQQGNSIVEARKAKVAEIKNLVERGEYEIDPKKTAEKMIEFWFKKRI